MYFTYSSSQNYIRTLTQGVTFTDTTKLNACYKRLSSQTTAINETSYFKTDYKREVVQSVNGITNINPLFTYFRKCLMTAGNKTGLTKFPFFNRFIFEHLNVNSFVADRRELNRKLDAIAVNSDTVNRIRGFIRNVIDSLNVIDIVTNPVLFIRTVRETKGITESFQQYKDYVRILYAGAGSITETIRQGDFYRKETDTVHAEGFVLRHLMIFIKLLTTSFVRDFIIRRFLIAKEQLILKSCITMEIILESRIN